MKKPYKSRVMKKSIRTLQQLKTSVVEKVYIRTLVTTLPATLAQCLGPLIDGMVIGNFLREEAVAAFGLVSPLLFVYSLVGAVIAGGARTTVANLIGDGDPREGNETFSMAFFLALGISVAMALLTILFSRPIAMFLGASGNLEHVLGHTRNYLIGFAIGVPAANCVRVLSAFMIMDGDGRRIVWSVTVMTVSDIIGDLVVIFAFSFPQLLARIYINPLDTRAYALTCDAVRCLALAPPMLLGAYCYDNYLMGINRIREANIFSIFLECAVSIPVTFAAIHMVGGRGAFIARPIAALLILLMVAAAIIRQKGDTYSEKALLLSDEFGFAVGKELELSVHSLDRVVVMSRLASMFAKENGADKKTAYHIGVATEEMAANIIRHGFREDKLHAIDIRVLMNDEGIILRIRDNCKAFNPKEYYEMMRDETNPDNLGIRMIVKIAKDIRYLNTMKTNNLIIRI